MELSDRIPSPPTHTASGVILARDLFGVQDEEILQTIENHTLGRRGMIQSGCIIFGAGIIDPGRKNTSEEELQLVRRENQDRTVGKTCDYLSLRGDLIMARNRLIHRRMILKRNWAMQMGSQNRPSAQDNNLIAA